MGKHPHEPDVNMLLRQCDVHNVALATNRATAELLIAGSAEPCKPVEEGLGPEATQSGM